MQTFVGLLSGSATAAAGHAASPWPPPRAVPSAAAAPARAAASQARHSGAVPRSAPGLELPALLLGGLAALALPSSARRAGRRALRGRGCSASAVGSTRSLPRTAALGRLRRSPLARAASELESLEGEELELLLQAAEAGDAESQFYAARLALDKDDLPKAAEWFSKAAEQGMANAQYNLGMMLVAGDGVEQDPAKGGYWLEQAANQGQAMAQYFFAVLCMQGTAEQRDMDKAMAYLDAAAENGVVDAQYTLGYMLMDSPKDALKEKQWAAHWLNKAAEQGDARAQYQIARMFSFGVGLEQSSEKAASWASAAANSGLKEAQYMMGTMLLAGDGVEKNCEWAAHWFQQAAEQGHIDAQYNLGLMLDSGDGIPEDKVKAAYWLKQAAAQGDSESARVGMEVTEKLQSQGGA